jgi:large subunit ribosomal protein L6
MYTAKIGWKIAVLRSISIMSKLIGKPIKIPKEVKLSVRFPKLIIQNNEIGWLITYPEDIKIRKKENLLYFEKTNSNSNIGLWYQITKNLMAGLSQNYTLYLSLKGLGFKVQGDEKNLNFRLGYSHSIEKHVKEKLNVEIFKGSLLKLSSFSKQDLGDFAASIRQLKIPDSYKGKGILYRGEKRHLKPGKKS